MNLNHTYSLSHTKWNCKYHTVFTSYYIIRKIMKLFSQDYF